MDPVYDFAEGRGDSASGQKPVIRQLRRYVEAKYRSGLTSVPRIAQLFAIDFLRALAELYRFLLNDERSPLRSAGTEILVAGEEEAETWERERASRRGAMDDRLRIRLDEHAQAALTDALTGLRTKEFFLRKLPEKFAALAKAGKPISIIMADIDHFKWVNDSLGHQTGDLVLKDAANTILDGVRRGQDAAIRYGGEEILILTVAPLHTAAALADRLRRTQAGHVTDRDLYSEINEIGRERGESCGTFSMGVVERTEGETLEACVERADKALYEAKHERNRVSVGHLFADSSGRRTLRFEDFADYVARVRAQSGEKKRNNGDSDMAGRPRAE
jgi:diguanylate cyclase (GGDEF)-like protein